VEPTATPGGLACLYQAYCSCCGAAYPARSGHRPQPGTGHDRPGLPRPGPPLANGPMLLSQLRTPRSRRRGYSPSDIGTASGVKTALRGSLTTTTVPLSLKGLATPESQPTGLAAWLV
jgi:hypothetical protein